MGAVQSVKPSDLHHFVKQPLDFVQRQDRPACRRTEIGRTGRRRRKFLDSRHLNLRFGTVAAADPRRRGDHQSDAQ